MNRFLALALSTQGPAEPEEDILVWQGEQVMLTAIQREYLPRYVEWLDDWEVRQYLMPGIPVPLSVQDEMEWYEELRKEKDQCVFAILTRAENLLIGNCGLHNIDLKNRCAMFGIFIGDKRYWGKGYGTDATRTLLRFAFEQVGLNRLELQVYAFNPRALRAYEKAGFTREGTRRQALYRNGEFHDVYLMGVLRQEWEKLK